VPRRRSVSRRMQAQIRRRAGALCEYCHTAEEWQYVPFTVDHIVPLAQGGANSLDNLALACFHCNRRKSAHPHALEPESNEVVPLFHPRDHTWSEHFMWLVDGTQVVGLTPIGKATIAALELNRERAITIRAADIAVGRHPPSGDAREQPDQPGS